METRKQSESPVEKKRAYRAPSLMRYGSLADLTQAGTFFGNDGNTECTGNANAAGQPCVS